MNLKRRRFVREYAKSGNAAEAARNAGYSVKTAYSIGEQLLRNLEIKAAVQRLEDAEALKAGVSREQQVAWLKGVQNTTLPGVINWDGKTLTVEQFDKLTPEQRSAVESFKLRETTDKNGNTVKIVEIKLKDSIRAAQELNRILGFTSDKRAMDSERPPVLIQINVPPPAYTVNEVDGATGLPVVKVLEEGKP